MEDNGYPSRAAILTAAARAFGSREPDENVRNPDWAADPLIGPAELALIADHALSKTLDQEFQKAIYDPEVYGGLLARRVSCSVVRVYFKSFA